MFGIKTFKPWVGKKYGKKNSFKVMVLGYSRYDEDYTDYDIINNSDGGRTHTNFIQAVLSKKYWEDNYDPFQFWHETIFYNYNTTFFPGKARVTPEWADLVNKQNSKLLKKMLEKYKPTHCIVWGKANWESIEVEGVEWGLSKNIPNLPIGHPYCTVTIKDHTTKFTYVKHPSTAFLYEHWRKVIKTFLTFD